MANMPEHKKRNTFTSYVAPPPGDINMTSVKNEWCLPTDTRDVHKAKPKLLANEQIIESAPAYMYSPIAPIDNETTPNKEAIFGLLSVTNFKLSFVPLQHQQQQTDFNHQNSNHPHHQQQPSQILQPSIPSHPHEHYCNQDGSYQENLYLQRNDVTLNNIDQIYQLTEPSRVTGGNKKKKIDAQQKNISGKITALHVVCKNFRLLKFAFQQQSSKTARDYGKHIVAALSHFAFPSRHELSFAFSYKEPYYPMIGKTNVTMFYTKNDWTRELIRCGATEWQVICFENLPQFKTATKYNNIPSIYSLPPNFVIPKCCSIDSYMDLSRAFCDNRAAFWVYSYGTASLVRLAELKPNAIQETKLENIMLEKVRKCDERKTLHLLQLTDRLPGIQDVQKSYEKFRRLCTPEGPQQFLLHDGKYYSLLEKTNWLFYVSLCLKYANEAANTLKSGTTCVLQDTNGRDLCCIISSLTQIILDPLYRTIDGFQSLIQKEWIALEHPFQTRLGHVRSSNEQAADEESPVFLLFLDCCWQLLQQYPDEFEYSQTYLTTLWDSCFLPLFDTFQFDTMADRSKAAIEKKLILRPVWDWGEQFAEKDKVFFTNPFYQKHKYLEYQQQQQIARRSVILPSSAIMLPGLATPSITIAATNAGAGASSSSPGPLKYPSNLQRNTLNPQIFQNKTTIPKDRYLQPNHSMCSIEVWEQCYYRWMPILEVQRGGYPQIDLYHRLLLSNIAKLQRALEFHDFDDLPEIYYQMTGEERKPTNDHQNQHQALGSHYDDIEYVDGVERRRKPSNHPNTSSANSNNLNTSDLLQSISSFFPFSINNGETSLQLLEILSSSNEFLLDGSIMDRLSMI